MLHFGNLSFLEALAVKSPKCEMFIVLHMERNVLWKKV